ncbi:MAG: hypothetical protein NT165_02090 [Candidatus Falkowbacteria bacterium]|nr:hypothetical protein [Candidatus Falkowbacteria bacterium]
MFKLKQNFSNNSYERTDSFELAISAPANEAIYPGSKDSYWSEDIKSDPELIAQAEKRLELSKKIQTLFLSAPENIQEEETVATYQELEAFIKSDPYNARLLLYLPFEMIPGPTETKSDTQLAETKNGFRDFYLEEWQKLLSQHDDRSNFSNGDIPEREIRRGSLPQVSKAAHLIPILIEKKLLSFAQVIALTENSDDSILCDSIMDTIPTLLDLRLISEDEIADLTKSPKQLLRNVGIIIQNEIKNEHLTEKNEDEVKNKNWLTELLPQANELLASIDEKAEKKLETLPASRVKWEGQQEKNKIISGYSSRLADALAKNQLNWTDFEALIKNNTQEKNSTLINLGTIQKFLENTATNNINEAQKLAIQSEPLFIAMAKNQESLVKESMESILSRLFSANIIDEEYLSKFNIPVTELGAKFSPENILNTEEFKELSQVIKKIESDPELSKQLYPISIVYGSKIKGYGAKEADLDLAFFIKPKTSSENRGEVQKSLGEVLTHEKISGTPLEFWLEESENKLKIKNHDSADKTLGNSWCTHVLFNGAWCGDKKVIQELYEKLMNPYLENNAGEAERNIWLSELERDTLQYRLMHKGYFRFQKEKNGINTKYPTEIDADSAFWDSGYRQLATKLFVEKVFIPKL